MDRQALMDYSVCNGVSHNNDGDIPTISQFYDVECQHSVNFQKRVSAGAYLTFPFEKKIYYGIGAFHISGHIQECFARYSPQFMPGIGIVDGEVLETLWSTLNEVSPSAQTASLAARTELLDDHMLDSNWKKIIHQDKGGLAANDNMAEIFRLQQRLLGRSTNRLSGRRRKASDIFRGYVKTLSQVSGGSGKRNCQGHKNTDGRMSRRWTFLM